MGQRIDQFCVDLRAKLTRIDGRFDSLKAKIDARAESAEQDVRGHLGELQRRIDQDRANVAAARETVKGWVENRKAVTADKIAGWKANHEIARLQKRADEAENYAAAAAAMAVAAMDHAEEAALEAWVARRDADLA